MKISYKGFMRERIQEEVVTISPDASFYEARTVIRDKGIRHLPVVDKNGHVVGLASWPMISGANISLISSATAPVAFPK